MSSILRLKALGVEFHGKFLFRKSRTEPVTGYTNRTEDGKYIITLDYDGLELNWIITELLALQDDFKLSSFFIFKSSSKGYHAVCLDKLTLKEFIAVLDESSADARYKRVPLDAKKVWVLRLTEKKGDFPEYLGDLPSSSKKEKSMAHRILLERFFNLKLPTKQEDQLGTIITAHYKV